MEGARSAFETDRKRILALLTTAKQRSKQQKASFNWPQYQLDVLDYLQISSQENWRETFAPLIQGVVTDQAERWNAAFGVTFDVQNLFALQWFEDYKLTFSNYIMTTSQNDLSALLQQGMYEGWSIPETQRHIGELFDQWTQGGMSDDLNWFEERMPAYRLEMIARTETMRASNVGSYNLFRQWKAPYKEWMATGDDRTRPSHMDAWGAYSRGGRVGPIPINDMFQVGGKDMAYPGDPAGGTAETVNCRCAILPSFEAGGSGSDIHASQWNDVSPYTNREAYESMFKYWEQQLNALPADQREAINRYTGAFYREINGYLRHGTIPWGMTEEQLKEHIRLMDLGLKGANQNFLAYRGGIPMRMFGLDNEWGNIEDQIGVLIQDKGFSSISIEKMTAKGYHKLNHAHATIRVPQGTPGAYVESISNFSTEHEFLLGHGTKFRVVEAFWDEVTGNRVPHFILEVVQ